MRKALELGLAALLAAGCAVKNHEVPETTLIPRASFSYEGKQYIVVARMMRHIQSDQSQSKWDIIGVELQEAQDNHSLWSLGTAENITYFKIEHRISQGTICEYGDKLQAYKSLTQKVMNDAYSIKEPPCSEEQTKQALQLLRRGYQELASRHVK
jgi:hypothetical protein